MFWHKKKTERMTDRQAEELLKAVEELAFMRTTDVITDKELPMPGVPFHSAGTDQATDKLVGIFMRTNQEGARRMRMWINALPFGLTGLNYLAEQERNT